MSEFFDEELIQSKVKAEIVLKYFNVWSKIILSKSREKKAAYIDLYSGPGCYGTGYESTPIQILKKCVAEDSLRDKIVTIFNDGKEEYAELLEKNIKNIPNIESLKYEPTVSSEQVGDKFTKIFGNMNLVPTFSFIDPWGYKGLSKKLINALVKDWGSDCLFFFNYNRINPGLNNPKVTHIMDALFDENHANKIREKLECLNTPEERELAIINGLCESFSKMGNNTYYIMPFRFVRAKDGRTSHYLIFVSKNKLGYGIMKDIMWKYSSEKIDGVGNFSFIPTEDSQLNFLYQYSRPLEELGEKLIKKYKGKNMKVIDIYNDDNIGTKYIIKNYKEALLKLESDGKIKAYPAVRQVRKGVKTMANEVIIEF